MVRAFAPRRVVLALRRYTSVSLLYTSLVYEVVILVYIVCQIKIIQMPDAYTSLIV